MNLFLPSLLEKHYLAVRLGFIKFQQRIIWDGGWNLSQYIINKCFDLCCISLHTEILLISLYLLEMGISLLVE